ncbi:hypothetical protein [Streptomyces violaceus]|uniref:Uncharacterized protein n=1 Tax=Streptomyces violaceus TaxID=1936 RepID=A0ABY9UKX8_STRVL|nr:hypothetical protein [Streptomyces janthinus]WND23519.1 hypothetical protein RI060_42100 [Streptomyces janthinus]GGS98326.1 hypothetical protein GCM10010270_82870 [Streptomyces janthinus]
MLMQGTGGNHGSWRSSFGATENRNTRTDGALALLVAWRSPSGAAEDRNGRHDGERRDKSKRWRSPSGATEDRNRRLIVSIASTSPLAVALQDAEDRNIAAGINLGKA